MRYDATGANSDAPNMAAAQPAQGRWQPTDEELARYEAWQEYEGLTSISKAELAALEAGVEAWKSIAGENAKQLEDAVAEVAALREQLAGWLIASCANCDLSIGQLEPGLWIHTYGPMIGQVRCNYDHGAESDRATPDERYYKRVIDAAQKAHEPSWSEKAAVRAFVQRVNARAEAEMLRTGTLEGAHHRAIEAELANYDAAQKATKASAEAPQST